MNTKQLLNEWRIFLNENRIISLSELVDIMKSNEQYTESDIDEFTKFWNANQFSSKYSQVIKNELEIGEPINHFADTITTHYHKVYQSAGPKITNAIGNGTYSVSDLRIDIDERLDKKKFNKNEIRQQCKYVSGRPVEGVYKDFDVIHSKKDWVIIEPKTIYASIAWAHGKPDGSEETDRNRRVGWCTATSSDNNMFPNYAGNLHMFYLIKTDYNNILGPERRLCLSYENSNGDVSLCDGNATVDANNMPIKKSIINKLVSRTIRKKITELVSQRKETSYASVYSKITTSQLIRQISQMKSQGVDLDQFEQELVNYASHAKNKDVVVYLMDMNYDDLNIDSFQIKSIIGSRKDLLEIDPTKELISKLINSEDPFIMSSLAARSDLFEIDPSGEIVKRLANSEDPSIMSSLAARSDLLEIDPSGEIIKRLANSEDPYVKRAVAERSDLLEIDPSGEIIKKLANDEDPYVKRTLAKRSDLLEVDPSGEIIKRLANDEDSGTRSYIAQRSDLLEVDPSGEIIKRLANDEDDFVRASIAGKKDLIKFDQARELILHLTNDKDTYVKLTISLRKDLLEIDPSGEIIKRLVNDKNESLRTNLEENPVYEEFLNRSSNISDAKLIRSYVKMILS